MIKNWLSGPSTKRKEYENKEIKKYEKLLKEKGFDIHYKTDGLETSCLVYEPKGGMGFSFGVVAFSKLTAVKDAYRIASNQNQTGIRRVNPQWKNECY